MFLVSDLGMNHGYNDVASFSCSASCLEAMGAI